MTSNLNQELKELVLKVGRIKDVRVDQINDQDPIIGPVGPLQLDSLDALELVIALQKKYGVRIASDKSAHHVFKSFTVLSTFIQENRKK